VDEAKISEVEDVKPVGYNNIPEDLTDPDTVKPRGWENKDGGKWEVPIMGNPGYKGPWLAERIANPDYTVKWTSLMIANLEYKCNKDMHTVYKGSYTHVRFEIRQVLSSTMYGNLIVTDRVEEAQIIFEETFFEDRDVEKNMLCVTKKILKEGG
jgi:calreticulin